MLAPGEAFLLRGGNDSAAIYERGRAVVVERRYAQNAHTPGLLEERVNESLTFLGRAFHREGSHAGANEKQRRHPGLASLTEHATNFGDQPHPPQFKTPRS